MISSPEKKVTILTARKLGFPIKYWFKNNLGIDVYVVALGDNNPQAKSDWIEKHIKKGYTDIAFMDDSIKNVKAIAALQSKYPDIRLKSLLAVEHLTYSEQNIMLENFYEDKFKSLL
jgi:hypothetical protein